MSLRRLAPWLVLLPALLLFWQLDYAPFWNPDEGRYAAASREMAFGLDGQKPDWLVPHLNTITRLNKPPLIYWLVGGSLRVFGPSEWSGRFIPALAALTILVVLFLWGRSVFGLRAGLAASLVWATTLIPFAMARTLNTDMLLTAAITLALWGLFGKFKSGLYAPLIAGLGLGLALLAKGPVGVAIPVGIFAIYAVSVRKSEKKSGKILVAALGVACLIGLPWYLAVQSQRPDFLKTFLFSENLGRFSGSKDFHDRTPFWYYLPVILGGLLPWTGFAVGIFNRWTQNDEERRTQLLWWLWAGLIVGFFSLSSTKLISYVLPAFPAIALLLGTAIARWEKWKKPARGFALGATVILQLGLVVALAMALRNDKILPRAEGAPFLWGIATVAAVGSVALLLTARRGQAVGVLATNGITAGALFLLIVPLAGKVARYEDASAVFMALQPILKPTDRIVSYKMFAPSGMFYTGQPITQFDFNNSSGLPPQEIAASPYFLKSTPESLNSFLQSKERMFWLIRGTAPDSFGNQLKLWGRNNDFFLYSNWPKPADFSFDFVAPRKRKTKSKLRVLRDK